MNDTATRPSFFSNIPVIDEKTVDAAMATDEEKALAHLSHSHGWSILKDYMNSLANTLDEANRKAITSQSSLEEIGRNTVIISFVREFIKKVTDKVADAADAVTTNGEQ